MADRKLTKLTECAILEIVMHKNNIDKPKQPVDEERERRLRRRTLGGFALLGLSLIPLTHSAYQAGAELAEERGDSSYSVGDFFEDMPLNRHEHSPITNGQRHDDEIIERTLMRGEDGQWHFSDQGINAIYAAGVVAGAALVPGRYSRIKHNHK